MNQGVPRWKVAALLLAAVLVTSGVRMQGCALPSWGVIVPGERQVLILRESAKDTPAQSRMFVNLRSEPSLEGRLTIDDPVDEHGTVKPVYSQYQPFALPELIIEASGKVIARKPLPDDATGVLAEVKTNGG